MKVFYGGIFIEKEALQEAGIQHPIKLEYYKIIQKNEPTKRNQATYGIQIQKTEYYDNNVITENKEICHICNDEVKIDEILKIFKKCAVTPISAQYVVEDLLMQSQ